MEEVNLLLTVQLKNISVIEYLRKLQKQEMSMMRANLFCDEEDEIQDEYDVFFYDTLKYPPGVKPHDVIN